MKNTHKYLYFALLIGLTALSSLPSYSATSKVPFTGHTVHGLQADPLPLLNNTFEAQHKNNFQGDMQRIKLKEDVLMMRVHTAIDPELPSDIKMRVLRGVNGTYLTANFINNFSKAQDSLALLSSWYKSFGGLAAVTEILVHEGTEVYIGTAASQSGTPAVIARAPGKKNRPEKIYQELRKGGGFQMLVPPTDERGKSQNSLLLIEKTYTLKS